jgi:DNA-binding response OmpR family regulator
MNPYIVLVITRSQSLAERLQRAFDSEPFRVRGAPSTAQALGLDYQPAVLVLDLPPGGGGRNIMRLQQQFQVPILTLQRPGQTPPTAVQASLDRPFETKQLAQLVRITLMHHTPGIMVAPGMCLDPRTRWLQVVESFHQLTPIGCQLLAILMASPGTAIRREEIVRRVWNTDQGDSTRALDVHIAHLRRRLELDPGRPRLIVTERGIGYRLQPPGPDR